MINSDFKNYIEDICENFINLYEEIYYDLKGRGKRNLLKYVNSFFRRWLFTSVVANIGLSPASVIFEGNKHRHILPVVKNKSKFKIGSMTADIVDYSIENSPVLKDLRYVYEVASEGIKGSDDCFFNEDFYKNHSVKFSIDDPEYINYIFTIGIRTGILKIMPSIGVTMICRGSDKIFKMDQKMLFDIVVEETINISAENLGDYMIGNSFLTTDDIRCWLKEENNVDKIFEIYFTEPEIEDVIINDEFEFRDFIDSLTFERGVAFDKWFLTPFGYYLGLILPEYTGEYSLFRDMEMFIDSINYSMTYDNEPTAMLYSPCTQYKLTDIGYSYFGIDKEIKSKYIFNSFSAYELAEKIARGEAYFIADELLYKYYPPFNVYTLRITWDMKKSVWFDIAVSEYFTLYELSSFILFGIFLDNMRVGRCRFYTIPKSPFTEYKYPEIRKNNSNVFNTYVHNIFKNKDNVMHSTEVKFGGINCAFDFKIEVKDISENKCSTPVPCILKASKNFEEMFYR